LTEPAEEPQEDDSQKAERIKEEGNVAFKSKRYGEAIDFYTKAIGMCCLFYI
jgi:DnaJ family protein C protein 7